MGGAAAGDEARARVDRTVDLDLGAEQVWRLLADDDARTEWFGGDTTIDVRPGGGGRVVDPDGTRWRVAVGEVDPGRRLTWRWWPDDGGPASDVAFVIEPVGPVTRLTVTESRPAAHDVLACVGAVHGRLLDLELLVLTRAVAVA
jgi:uncharacterized protein YndB with AHSA1/START domain